MERIPEWIFITGTAYMHGAIIGLIVGAAAAAFGADFWPWFASVAAIDGSLITLNCLPEMISGAE